MPAFDTTRRVAYSRTEMFDLVADVEAYPQFLPLCEGLRVLSRERTGDIEVIVAAMDVGYKAIRETFTSRVTLDRAALTVVADLVEGPFRQMQNRWNFVAVEGGCDVRFHIAYEFKSMMLQLLVGAMFDQAFRKFTEAFELRAKAVYGPRAVTGSTV
ncbi:MAG: type II toxin-antitoxin system RatA family toxin [Hyphomicrobiaceae bacterium]